MTPRGREAAGGPLEAGGSPSSRRSSWTSTTSSRAGTATGSRPRETLHELDLDYVAEDFVERGILTGRRGPAQAAAERRKCVVKAEKKTKIVKTIKIDVDKCNGCRACEVICSAFHAAPQYSSNNPARSRIRVIRDPLADIYVPVYAGEYTAAECAGRDKYTIDGKEYEECAFCRASCPSRDVFKEPDSGLPLKCDMCESDPTLEEPMCVQWCLADALIYEEREEEVEDEESRRRSWTSGWRPWPTSTAGRRCSTPCAGCRRRPDDVSTRGNRRPLRRDRRGDQGGRRRGLQVLLPVRQVRRRLPLEPGARLQHPQDRPAGHPRPARDRARGHLALHDLRHLPVALPPGRRADRGRRRPPPDRHRVRRVPRLGAARCAPPAAASPPTATP